MAQSPRQQTTHSEGHFHPSQRQRPLTDVQRIVRLHLSDPNHVITDEELASIRIGQESFDADTLSMDGDDSSRNEAPVA